VRFIVFAALGFFIMYSLSTCWNSGRHMDGRAMLLEIRDLGFEYAELSHGIRISLLPGVIAAVEAGEIKISSVHNFCPLPIGVSHAAPNIFKFTSDDPRERENAYRHSLKTIEMAARLKATTVVLHMGDVEMKDYTHRLIEMAEDGRRETPKYERLCLEAIGKRSQKKERYVQLATDMLRRLADQASSYGVKLGIENREAIEEIPLEDEFSFMLEAVNSPAVGYWHDTGHAQIKENLGCINHAMHLETMAPNLLGFHIHDVQFPARDHCPPGEGTVDFAAMKAWLKPEHCRVLELHPAVTSEQVVAGFAHLKKIWNTE
jgi:sugar phosphate isomerase/epimerase